MSKRSLTALLAACAAAASVAGVLSAGSAGAATSSGSGSARVIVVLRNQENSLPDSSRFEAARRQALSRVQAPLRSQMLDSGALDLHTFSLIDAISATVSPAEEARLRANPAVQEVVPDQVIHLGPSAQESASSSSPSSIPVPHIKGLCSTNGKPQLNPQALQLIGADSQARGAKTARSLGFNGAGVKVGFIADGLNINDRDFIRANGRHVIVAYKDFTGEGTNVPTGGGEAFGDASSIAAQGRTTYNVKGYGPRAVKQSCPIRIEGVAPGASMVALDIFGAENAGYNSSFLQAIDYAVTRQHVNVLNESLGQNIYPDDSASLDLIKRANDAAVSAGTTVTVSSGDAGSSSTIGSPSDDPLVISAGATTQYRATLQSGYVLDFNSIHGYLNNEISAFSSSGFDQRGHTLDLVAPGEDGWALCSRNLNQWAECGNFYGKGAPIQEFGGTSESAPLTAGAAALVIQAYRRTHHANPRPWLVKELLVSTAKDIGAPAEQQGAGLLDVYRAVLAAESYGLRRHHGASVLFSRTQMSAVAGTRTRERFTDTIVNEGARATTVHLSARTLGPYRTIASRTVVLDDNDSPHVLNFEATPSNYEPITFTVPRGENRLMASIAYKAAYAAISAGDLNARGRLTLVDPRDRIAEYSVPQGDGNYGNIQITNPLPGRWTAYVWSREGSQGGTTGPYKFGAAVARYTGFGRLSTGRFRLLPGQARRFTLRVSTPSHPGDVAGSIVIRSAEGRTSVPVTLRSLIPTGNESFKGTLTGGNGRSVITGQTFYYQLRLPRGEPELNANVKLANNPDNPFTAFLVSPSGEALATASNTLPDPSSQTGTDQELGAQLHVIAPQAGTWTLIVAFVPYVSGTTLAEPFKVTTSESPVRASASGLPDSADEDLPAGATQTATVTITNRGPEPEAYFLDPRLPHTSNMQLVSLSDATTTVPLTASSVFPVYGVPTHTSRLRPSATTSGTEPIQFDSSGPAGDPDIGSGVGTTVAGLLKANPIAPGAFWDIAPDVVGPFGANGVAQEQVTTSMTATTDKFNDDMSPQTGDLWKEFTGRESLSAFNPVVVNPGHTAHIRVALTPGESPGTTVSGTLYLNDTTEVLFGDLGIYTGDEVAAFPYAYTVAPDSSSATSAHAKKKH